MEKNSNYLFEKASITKAMLNLALPAVLVSMVDLVYSTINSYYIGQLDNNYMLAGMEMSTAIDMFIESVGACIGIGGASYLGRQLGAKNKEGVYETVRTSITLALLLAIIHLVISIVILKPYILWQSDDPAIFDYAFYYGLIDIITCTVMAIRTVSVHLLRSCGDVKYSSRVIIASIFVNILIAPVLMFDWGLGLGVYGAAIATAIVRLITAILCLMRINSHNVEIYWKPFDFHIDKQISKEILKVGIPCYIRNALPCLATSVYSKEVFKFGTDFVAGCSVGKRSSHFMTYFIQGVSNGYLSFASYNYGAKNYKRLWDCIKWNLLILTTYSIGVGALLWIFSREYVGIFTQSAIAIEYGIKYARAYTLALPCYAAYYIFTVSLQAAGKGKESMWLSLSRQGLIYIPVMLILPRLFNENGIYLSQPLSDWLSVITAIILCLPLLKEIRNGIKNKSSVFSCE